MRKVMTLFVFTYKLSVLCYVIYVIRGRIVMFDPRTPEWFIGKESVGGVTIWLVIIFTGIYQKNKPC